MAKYQVMLTFSEGTTEMEDEVFDTYDEAWDYGCEYCSDYAIGGEILEMSNPGDYPQELNPEIDFDIIRIED